MNKASHEGAIGISRFGLQRKSDPLPAGYVLAIFIAVLLFELLPYVQELWRGWRANVGRLVPAPARRARARRTDTLQPCGASGGSVPGTAKRYSVAGAALVVDGRDPQAGAFVLAHQCVAAFARCAAAGVRTAVVEQELRLVEAEALQNLVVVRVDGQQVLARKPSAAQRRHLEHFHDVLLGTWPSRGGLPREANLARAVDLDVGAREAWGRTRSENLQCPGGAASQAGTTVPRPSACREARDAACAAAQATRRAAALPRKATARSRAARDSSRNRCSRCSHV
jgi:hypothetical protein